MKKERFKSKLDSDGILCAEGFLFEIERRGLHGLWRICARSRA